MQHIYKEIHILKECENELKSIGLTQNEAKVYCNLLQNNVFTATELANSSGVNRSRIYSVLNDLINKGLCFEKLGKVKKYVAINPETSFEKIKNEQQKKLEQVNVLQEKLTPIYNSQKDIASPLDFIEVYGTPASIIKKHHTLELESKECVLSFCKAPYAMSAELDIHMEQVESMKNEVIYKSIFEVEKNDIKFFARRMKNFEDQGEEIKVAYHLPIKLHVFDDHIVMFSMINKINPDEDLTYMVISHPDLAETLITTFYNYWDEAMTVDEFIAKENLVL